MKQKIILLSIFILGIILYILTVRGIYGNPLGSSIKNKLDQATQPFELSPERGRFLLTLSLAEDKSFALSQKLADAAYPDVGYYKGRFYIFFPPGISLLALPLYKIGKNFNLSQVFSFFSISIFAVFTLLFLYKTAKEIFKLPVWISFLIPIIFAFGSTSWSYAITLYQHLVTAFLIVSSFYAVWKYAQRGKLSWIWALFVWFAYGFAILIDYPNAFLMLPVMIYFFFSAFKVSENRKIISVGFRLSLIFTSIFFLVITGLHLYYNQVNFGNWKTVSGSLVGYKKIKEAKINTKNQQGQSQISTLQSEKEPVAFFHEESTPKGFSILLFSRDRGLFLYSPIFLLAILGILAIRKKINLEIAILLGIIGVNLFLYSSWGDPWGGWAYGPRYLIPSMAILSIFIGFWLNETKHKIISKILTFVLFAYSCAIALLGALTTNQVPPKIEADYLHMQYNFLLNFHYLVDDRSGSFMFNHFASHYMNLTMYFSIIFYSLLFVVFVLLFIVSRLNNK